MIAGSRGILEIEQTKGQSTQKEREEHAQLNTIEFRDIHSTAGAKRCTQKSSRTDKKRNETDIDLITVI